MASRGRRTQSGGETWAGFVDALSALLMVLIFALSVFMMAQLFQGAALTGQNQVMSRLQARINDLTDMLSLERDNNATVREQLTRLSAELQQSAAARDHANRSLALLSSEHDALQAERSALEARVLASERELDDARAHLQLLAEDLDGTRDDAAASKDALARRSVQLASLQRDIDALEQVRRNLEGEVGRLLLVLEEAQVLEADLERRLADLDAELSQTRTALAQRETELSLTEAGLQESRGREEELAQTLKTERSELERLALLLRQSREAEERTAEALAARELQLEDAGTRIDQLIASLSSVRDRTLELEAELSTEEERNLLAQREVADSNQQITELTRRLGIVEGERDRAVELGGSQAQQIADLRDRLASLNSVLEAAEIKAAQDLVQITSLGERLNAALAARVQDLSRYQSDFLARLHDHLGNREGVKVEGDRFIIQSGVLFSSGSADISEAGRENLRQIADLIRGLVSDIPDDVDWILRVDGHTDSKPIQTTRFPSNWELSTARATSVVRFLISLGVPEHRLMAAGLSEFRPLAAGEDTDTMQRNRRIEFKLTDP